jgi:hypothetical protein
VGHDGPVPWRWVTPATPGRSHYGGKMATLAGAMRKPFMPWQSHVGRVASEIDPDTGEWAYQTIVLSVQRQAGKTTLMIPSNLHECMREPDSYCWYTAQTRQAARDNFLRDVKPLMRSALSKLVKLRKSNGSEGLEIPANGSEYRVFTAGSDELHGKTNRRATVDEAWAYDALAGIQVTQAIVPSFTTTAGQLWVVSTAGTAESVWLDEWVKKGRAAVESGQRTGIAHFECAIPPDTDATDLLKPGPKRDALIRLVLDNHPGRGHTLKQSALLAALSQMDPWEWARAYGNLWMPTAENLISASDWVDCTDRRDPLPMPPKGRAALGFDVDPDDAGAVVCAAWHDEDGIPCLSVVQSGQDTSWLVPRLDGLDHDWLPAGTGFNDYGPSGVAADAARRAQIPVSGLSGHEYATACAAFKKAIADKAVRVQPSIVLDTAIAALARRRLGDAWVWDRRTSAGSIAAVVAATVALWTLEHAPPRFEVG